MVKHIILWTLKETDADKKAEILANMKEHLEGLAGKVPGLLEVHVRTNPLASSNAEVMLDTTLENEEMLKVLPEASGACRSCKYVCASIYRCAYVHGLRSVTNKKNGKRRG